MRRIVEPSHLSTESAFGGAARDLATQRDEAQSILRIVGADRPLRILDLACGMGTHAIHWAAQGHKVTAVDISVTFIARAREQARREDAPVVFAVSDIRQLNYRSAFDVVTWIEHPFFDEQIVGAVRQYLVAGGTFIVDVRNPEHPLARQCQADQRTWREEDGVFHLESHQTDPATGQREDVWIEIDTRSDTLREHRQTSRPLRLHDHVNLLQAAGFTDIHLRTMDGDVFAAGPEPYWLWLVAKAPPDG